MSNEKHFYWRLFKTDAVSINRYTERLADTVVPLQQSIQPDVCGSRLYKDTIICIFMLNGELMYIRVWSSMVAVGHVCGAMS